MFLVVAVAAAALWGLEAVVRGLRQAASQRTAAAVAERAGQGTIAECDDAALEHTDFPVVTPALAKDKADADAVNRRAWAARDFVAERPLWASECLFRFRLCERTAFVLDFGDGHCT